MMTSPAIEFSRPFDVRYLPRSAVRLSADEAERAALLGRLQLVGLDALEATVTLAEQDGGRISATGQLTAQLVQSCVISGEDVPAAIDMPLALIFVVAHSAAIADDADIELDSDTPDEIEYDGASFDLGEAITQTLALALDPFPRAPDAEALRKAAGVLSEVEAKAANSPFAALSQLKR